MRLTMGPFDDVIFANVLGYHYLALVHTGDRSVGIADLSLLHRRNKRQACRTSG